MNTCAMSVIHVCGKQCGVVRLLPVERRNIFLAWFLSSRLHWSCRCTKLDRCGVARKREMAQDLCIEQKCKGRQDIQCEDAFCRPPFVAHEGSWAAPVGLTLATHVGGVSLCTAVAAVSRTCLRVFAPAHNKRTKL
jgi:hypothetical protein